MRMKTKAGVLWGLNQKWEVEEVELDGAGRLLISPSLRQYAGLEKEIWLIGQGRHFEIWSAAGWKAQQDAIFAVGDKLLPPGLENLAL